MGWNEGFSNWAFWSQWHFGDNEEAIVRRFQKEELLPALLHFNQALHFYPFSRLAFHEYLQALLVASYRNWLFWPKRKEINKRVLEPGAVIQRFTKRLEDQAWGQRNNNKGSEKAALETKLPWKPLFQSVPQPLVLCLRLSPGKRHSVGWDCLWVREEIHGLLHSKVGSAH